MPKKGIPDRWLDYSNCGKCILRTRFVAFKVPLNQSLVYRLPPEEQWTTDRVFHQLPSLGLVIDLTYTSRYYDPEVFRCRNVKHVKILCQGHGQLPSPHNMSTFFDTVSEFLKDPHHTGQLIGVHCTHGLNRTGYFICRYMIDRMGFSPGHAISAFNDARGHRIERQPYLEALARALPGPEEQSELGSRFGSDRPDGPRWPPASNKESRAAPEPNTNWGQRIVTTDGCPSRSDRYRWTKDRPDGNVPRNRGRTEEQRNGHPYGTEGSTTAHCGTHFTSKHQSLSPTDSRQYSTATANSAFDNSSKEHVDTAHGGGDCTSYDYKPASATHWYSSHVLEQCSTQPAGTRRQYGEQPYGTGKPRSSTQQYGEQPYGTGKPSSSTQQYGEQPYGTGKPSSSTQQYGVDLCGARQNNTEFFKSYGTDPALTQKNSEGSQYGSELAASKEYGRESTSSHQYGTSVQQYNSGSHGSDLGDTKYSAGGHQYGTGYISTDHYSSSAQQYGTDLRDGRDTKLSGEKHFGTDVAGGNSSQLVGRRHYEKSMPGTQRYSSEQSNTYRDDKRWSTNNHDYNDSKYQDNPDERYGSGRGSSHSWNDTRPSPAQARGGSGYRRPYHRPKY